MCPRSVRRPAVTPSLLALVLGFALVAAACGDADTATPDTPAASADEGGGTTAATTTTGDTADEREAGPLDIVRAMAAEGALVKAFDPVAMENAQRELGPIFTPCKSPEEVADGADALVIATEWHEFRMLNLAQVRERMRTPILVDCKNIYDPPAMTELGFRHIGIGRGKGGA